MSLKKNIENQLQVALKTRKKEEVSTLRLILASIKDQEIANRKPDIKSEIKNEDLIQVLKKMLKQRVESAEVYKENKRIDLFESEEKEIQIIQSFLPKQLSEEETKKICQDAIKSLGASSAKDMGKIMGNLKKNYSQVIDFSKVNKIVKDLLN